MRGAGMHPQPALARATGSRDALRRRAPEELHGRHHRPDADHARLVRRPPTRRPRRRRGLPRPRRPFRLGRHRRHARRLVALPVLALALAVAIVGAVALAAGAELGAGLTAVEADEGESHALHALALSFGIPLALGSLGERLLGGGPSKVALQPAESSAADSHAADERERAAQLARMAAESEDLAKEDVADDEYVPDLEGALSDLLAPPAVAQRDRNGALGVALADDEAVEFGNDFAGREVSHWASHLLFGDKDVIRAPMQNQS